MAEFGRPWTRQLESRARERRHGGPPRTRYVQDVLAPGLPGRHQQGPRQGAPLVPLQPGRFRNRRSFVDDGVGSFLRREFSRDRNGAPVPEHSLARHGPDAAVPRQIPGGLGRDERTALTVPLRGTQERAQRHISSS